MPTPTEPAHPAHPSAPAEPSAAPAPSSGPTDRPLCRYTLPGASVALLLVCLSFTPSLLPRPAFFQGFVCGVTAAIGYGIGVVGAWLWRQFADRPVRQAGAQAWRIYLVVAE